jgi:hypothetical protein
VEHLTTQTLRGGSKKPPLSTSTPLHQPLDGRSAMGAATCQPSRPRRLAVLGATTNHAPGLRTSPPHISRRAEAFSKPSRPPAFLRAIGGTIRPSSRSLGPCSRSLGVPPQAPRPTPQAPFLPPCPNTLRQGLEAWGASTTSHRAGTRACGRVGEAGSKAGRFSTLRNFLGREDVKHTCMRLTRQERRVKLAMTKTRPGAGANWQPVAPAFGRKWRWV